jgi:hypothetical protein
VFFRVRAAINAIHWRREEGKARLKKRLPRISTPPTCAASRCQAARTSPRRKNALPPAKTWLFGLRLLDVIMVDGHISLWERHNRRIARALLPFAPWRCAPFHLTALYYSHFAPAAILCGGRSLASVAWDGLVCAVDASCSLRCPLPLEPAGGGCAALRLLHLPRCLFSAAGAPEEKKNGFRKARARQARFEEMTTLERGGRRGW